MKERLQKIIAARGLASRRAAEIMISEGKVKVDGVTASLGDSADPELQQILVDGRLLPGARAFVYVMLNKPRGFVTTMSDEKGRKTAAELVQGVGTRVLPVGRLDLNSEGLLFFTNDGDFIRKLTHPGSRVEKTYLVWAQGNAAAALEILSAPMTIDGQRLARASVRIVSEKEGQALLKFTVREGKNRQIRKMCIQAGLSVTRLKRVSEGGVELGELAPGKWRYLEQEELARLLRL